MLGLGYELVYFSSLSDKFDSIVLIGENLEQSCYPDFVSPHVNAVKAIQEVKNGNKRMFQFKFFF